MDTAQFNLADYSDPLAGLVPGGFAILCAVAQTREALAPLSELCAKPCVIESPQSNRYGLWRLFELGKPQSRLRAAL